MNRFTSEMKYLMTTFTNIASSIIWISSIERSKHICHNIVSRKIWMLFSYGDSSTIISDYEYLRG